MELIFDYTSIACFLSPSSRDRIVYELSSPKKRMKAWMRFSHGVEDIINTEYIHFKGNYIDEKVKFEIEKHASEGVVLSFEFQTGKIMSINDVFDYLSKTYNTTLALIENWLVIKKEYEGGNAEFYILRKKDTRSTLV